MSGNLRSAQLSTPNTTSAYSQVADHDQSFTHISSMLGSVLTMTL